MSGSSDPIDRSGVSASHVMIAWELVNLPPAGQKGRKAYTQADGKNWTHNGTTWVEDVSGGAHPDLATHDALGLATDTELTTHAGAADPHTGYRLESADHTHQSAGAQGGVLDHGLALTGLGDDDHTQYTTAAEADAAAAAAVTTHEGLADPHTAYRLESDLAVESIAKSGSAALTGAVTLSQGANVTLTQVGQDIEVAATGAAGAPSDADYLVGTANAGLSAEIVVGTAPGGELGGTWAAPTVDATHSGSAHHTQAHSGADHTDPAAATTVDIGDTAAAGTGTNPPAADDHVHGFPAPGAGYPLDVSETTEADGTATTPARSDHQHKLGTRTFTISSCYKTPAVDSYIVWRAPFACTVTALRGYVDAGNTTVINAFKGTLAAPTNFSTADMIITSADAWISDTTLDVTSIAANDAVGFEIQTAGTATEVTIQLDLTRP